MERANCERPSNDLNDEHETIGVNHKLMCGIRQVFDEWFSRPLKMIESFMKPS